MSPEGINTNTNEGGISKEVFEGDLWEIPNTVSAARGAEKELEKRALESGWAEEEINDFIEIAFHEALANAMIHGNLGVEQVEGGKEIKWSEAIKEADREPAGNVEVSVSVGAGKIEVSVKDYGKGFTPEKVADPTIDKNVWKTSGRGLKLIEHFSDELQFSEGGTKITIVKNKPQENQ